MKLPPIWAELPPLLNPERTKKMPPIIAERTITSPRIAGTWTFLGLDLREKVSTMIANARIASPMNA